MTTPVLSINGDRLWRTIARSSEIGVGRPGGLSRLPLSDADREMRDQYCAWCRDANLAITIDEVGNIFARRAGHDDTLAPVTMGSHLDSQVNGGRFDGILGVLAALEVVRTLDENNITTKRPIVIAMWTNEEGARFTPPMLGSSAFARLYPVPWVYARADDDGVTFGDELTRIGYRGDTPVGAFALDSYFELHIEQGPELDRLGIPVGIVTHGYTVHGYIIDVRGETAHTGPWPMDRRRNALVGAAMLATAVNDIGWKYHETAGKATASRITAWPNKPGILSDRAQLTADVRHNDPETADRMRDELLAAMAACAKRSRCDLVVADEWHWGAHIFDDAMVAMLRDTASRLGIPTVDLPSQAGHDAYAMAKIAPTAMVFTPCRDGITHNNLEDTTLEQTVPGVNLLLNAVVDRANRR